MRFIIKYENFNESKGISDSCNDILNDIWSNIENNIIKLNSGYINFNVEKSDIKANKIELNYNLNKGSQNTCNGETILKNSKIENDILLNVEININISYNDMDDQFIYYIKSVILHELLHVFQHYNILSKKRFRPESFSIGSMLPQFRKIVKTNYASYLIDILYYSLSHELSAQLHQYYLYKVDNREYKRLDDIENLLKNFNIKNLTNDEKVEISLIQNHTYNAIKYLSKNNKYLKDIKSSIWNEKDIDKFLIKIKNIIDLKVKWINKKKALINLKINESKLIRYDDNTTLPQDWEFYDILEKLNFIKDNISDTSNINFI